ncbi:DUF2683 family protein [Chryseobacterium arthrosphaerae]|uniref:DUF2683 family protein n=1 Tax=Chryseobacterium arthrosphaerae TaxID=651561 RepID=A0A1B8ZBH6_9FLAO|nr:DUF2683 family protein [Chryseobacterium arthrosphaerae]AYZ14107.1 hypothetical protein EGY05_20160 [Chryseobacterium arthrosphaerae]MDG4650798.1 hypothetical protein [Chryseobacterium arthrosphaerae]OCA68827.1 hypothetical protein BBI00_21755 [Chryseobacterium arthrosphaerae]RTZ50129.1 hypothetical protein EJ377_09010 [Chryseobacterium arthrosphaerae]WES96080.1 hypothetical protein P2W68_14610 [Chryseobacterium arthrosphaerae]
MESIIVHPKNSMELSALKSVLKEMNIKFEKAHVKSSYNGQKVVKKASDTRNVKPASKPSKPKGQ